MALDDEFVEGSIHKFSTFALVGPKEGRTPAKNSGPTYLPPCLPFYHSLTVGM